MGKLHKNVRLVRSREVTKIVGILSSSPSCHFFPVGESYENLWRGLCPAADESGQGGSVIDARIETSCPSPRMRSGALQQGDAERTLHIRQGSYHLRLAVSESDWLAAFRLRFLVFNLELGEGLETAYATGHDVDPFDAVCDHLIVEHAASGAVVGTYRMQTGIMAAANLGFYSER